MPNFPPVIVEIERVPKSLFHGPGHHREDQKAGERKGTNTVMLPLPVKTQFCSLSLFVRATDVVVAHSRQLEMVSKVQKGVPSLSPSSKRQKRAAQPRRGGQ